jgi:WD40 repeat protein
LSSTAVATDCYIRHWQLRHYISTPETDLLYYASGNDIYCLNTATKKRKRLATLPFEARCTASGFGYVCVGGEQNGHFACIKLDGTGHRSSTGEVDSALPIPHAWQRQQSSNGAENVSFRRATDVKVETIGEEIVNSISVHRIQNEEAHLDDIVAVLTNNDNTVRLYSLPAGLETNCLRLPYPMNHATISPDGQYLVAVGDTSLAYFFKRDIQHPPPQIPKPHNRLTSAHLDWTLTNVVELHASEPGGTQCYFTTAWSPSGQLVAVGSEGGYITVFDIDMLQDPDVEDDEAVVAVVPSSRPDFSNPHPGAIRSMMFSPEPWDLLIWAEDQGRICIGDLRTGLKTRQVINLEPKDEKLRRLVVDDVEPDESPPHVETITSTTNPAPPPPRDLDELEEDVIRRYRQAADSSAAESFTSQYIEARRRQRLVERERAHLTAMSERLEARDSASSTTQQRQQGPEDDPRGLTAHEQRILETLRTTRQREEARMWLGSVPRAVNYTSAEMFRDAARSITATGGTSTTDSGSTTTATSSSARPTSESLTAALDSNFPELSRTNALSPQLRPSSSRGPAAEAQARVPPVPVPRWSTREQDDPPRVVVDGVRLPRRRASVILTPEGRVEGIQRDGESNTSTTTPAAAAAAAAAEEEEENPWRTIEEHMSLSRGPLFESATATAAGSRDGGGYTGAAATPSAAAVAAARQRILQQTAREQLDDQDRAGSQDYESAAERARIRAIAQARQRERWRRLPTNSTGAASAEADSATTGSATITAATAAQVERLQGAINANSDILIRRAQLRGAAGAQIGVHGYVVPGGREIGVRTAGLAMSTDGRMLWAACEEGVFEIGICVKGRMFWGAVEPR